MMKKFNKLFIAHQPQLLFLLILFVAINFLSELPYFNLILNEVFVSGLLWLTTIVIFKLSGRFSIKMALVFLLIGLILVILKQERLTEKMGNLAYGLFWVGALQELFAFFLRKDRSS